MYTRSPRQVTLALTASVALAVLLSSCSSSGGSSSTTSSPPGSTSAGGSSSTSSVPSNDALAKAKADLQQLEQRPTSITIPSLPHKPATGKSIDVVACSLPICQSNAAAMKVAAAAIGWSEKTLQAGLTPQGVAAAYDQAVRDKPAGVLGLGGFPPTLFSHQLQELAAENVPVAIPQADPENLKGITYDPVNAKVISGFGTELGEWVLNDANASGINAAIFTTSATPEYDVAHTSFSAEIKSGCSSCSVATSNFPEADIGTSLPTVVVTYLRAHPSTNYLFFDFSNEVDGVPAALASAGLASKVKIVTIDTSPTESAYIAAGQEAATAGAPNLEGYWSALNVFARASEGLDLAPGENVQLPNWIITKDNLPSTTASFPLVANYQDLFKTAWGVS